MQEQTNTQELRERLELIESMLAAGRRKTENAGWWFVLWGVAYYVAILWATWGNPLLAWPITMFAAFIATVIVQSRIRIQEPETTIGRAIGSLWMSLGITMFMLFMAMGISRRFEVHVFVATISAMLGMANAASGLILKWKMQLACAVVWWTAAVVTCFTGAKQTAIVFLAAIFFGQIVFGIYAMIRGSKRRREAVHA
jgi:hypothetical protein